MNRSPASAPANTTPAGLRADGTVACWGGLLSSSGRAVPPLPPDRFSCISAGNESFCGVRDPDRCLLCWAAYTGSALSVDGPSLDRFKSVSTGEDYFCAVREDDRMLCWGRRARALTAAASSPIGKRDSKGAVASDPVDSDGTGGRKAVKPLLQRREDNARKQAARGKGVFAGQEPRGSGPANRHGMPKLPTGQRAVTDWPVLDLGDHPRIETSQWRLEVDGLCEVPLALGWDEFLALPQTEDTSDFHCVTTWSRMDMRWRGVRFRDLAALARPKPSARFVLTTGYDSDALSGEPYTTNLSLEEATKSDVLLVHTVDGAALPREHGGPCRMITPQLYAWKGAKWIRRITFTPHNQPGFWERRGYSNTAIPWFDDRYGRGR